MAAERAAKVGTTTALLVLVGGALAVYGLDQLSKFLVVTNLTEGEVVPVLGTVLQWQFVRNPGAAFSLASGMTWIFTILAAGVITFIVWFARRIRSIAWALVFGLLLGGVLGNLTDRLLREPSFGLGPRGRLHLDAVADPGDLQRRRHRDRVEHGALHDPDDPRRRPRRHARVQAHGCRGRGGARRRRAAHRPGDDRRSRRRAAGDGHAPLAGSQLAAES